MNANKACLSSERPYLRLVVDNTKNPNFGKPNLNSRLTQFWEKCRSDLGFATLIIILLSATSFLGGPESRIFAWATSVFALALLASLVSDF